MGRRAYGSTKGSVIRKVVRRFLRVTPVPVPGRLPYRTIVEVLSCGHEWTDSDTPRRHDTISEWSTRQAAAGKIIAVKRVCPKCTFEKDRAKRTDS